MTRRILTAAILIPFVLASLLLFPLPAFLLVLDALLIVALREFSQLGSTYGSKLYPSSYILALIAPWIISYYPNLSAAFSLSATLITLVWCVFSTRSVSTSFHNVAGNLFGLSYLVIPFCLIATFHHTTDPSGSRPYELILVFVVVWTSDAAALFVGRAIGKHRITPSISPNKTLEGYLAGLVFPVIAAVVVGAYFVPESSLPFLLAVGLIIAITAILGDLFESILKRGADIKDTSNLIPGHGGVLDRVDSLLLAVPAYYLLAILCA